MSTRAQPLDLPAARAAITDALEWMQSNPPADGWGCLDRRADAERREIMARLWKLLEPGALRFR